MTYGDGSGTYFDVLTSIDVAAHELDMSEKTANLAYQKESGAMNEASLIFGELVSNITQHLENLLG
jgi:Zn-dependent metalloprotease